MEIRKITTRKIYEELADQLADFIRSGQLKPGEKLPSTKELSERYQVGRSTMREALSALKAMGLVEIKQGEGCYVRETHADRVELPDLQPQLMSAQTVMELTEARKALEVSNAGWAAVRRSDADVRELEELVERMADSLKDEEESKRLDAEFHMSLARATGNPILVRLLEAIGTQVQMAIRDTWNIRLFEERELAERLLEEHRELLRAVREGDSDKARTAMEAHLGHVERVLLAGLSEK